VVDHFREMHILYADKKWMIRATLLGSSLEMW